MSFGDAPVEPHAPDAGVLDRRTFPQMSTRRMIDSWLEPMQTCELIVSVLEDATATYGCAGHPAPTGTFDPRHWLSERRYGLSAALTP